MTVTEDRAENTVRSFMALFNDGRDPDAIAALFASNAQFWGTTMTELGEGTKLVRAYFADAFARRMGHVTAGITQISAMTLSETAVALAGRWEVARSDRVVKLRFSMVLHSRDGRWLIAQFHSSRREET